jgi:hypothetical protein
MKPKGRWMDCPKKRNSNAGVRNIPAKLLMTALQSDDATLPPEDDVSKMHMLIVVGKQVSMSKPSKSAGGKRLGRKVLRAFVKGRPTRKGHTPNVTSCTAPFNL